MNNISIVGRVGADPTLKYTKTGVAVATFSVAVTSDFKNANGERDTTWFECVAWKQTAEFVCNYLGKSRLVAVTGRMQRRQYDAQDGTKRTVWELVANTVNGLDKAPEGHERQPEPGDTGAAYDDPFQDE